MPPAAFEPAIPASEQPPTHAVDHPATGNCNYDDDDDDYYYYYYYLLLYLS
jgi:hypothetical protein